MESGMGRRSYVWSQGFLLERMRRWVVPGLEESRALAGE